MALNLSSLESAVRSLENALKVAADNDFMSKLTNEQADTIRAGVIQNFEFTYELCWKFIQRWLKDNRPNEDIISPRTRKELFRIAARHGLIADPLPWFEYGDARNLTAHIYNESKAQIVYESAKRFITDAKALLKQLESNND